MGPEKVRFCTRMKKMNWAFRINYVKRAKWGSLISKSVQCFVKISNNNLYWNMRRIVLTVTRLGKAYIYLSIHIQGFANCFRNMFEQ